MMQKDSNWVSDLFAAAARDWTPAAARYAAHVLYAPFLPDPEVSRRCASVLSDSELESAERFLTENSKARFIQRRAFRRYCGALALESPWPLSRICFKETEKGRPYLPDLPNFWFSFSSCQSGFLGAWSSTHGIGVDFEDRIQSLEAEELAQQYFSEVEAKAVESACGQERLQTFLQFWCLKEATLKSVGEGLPFGLDAFQFELAPNPRVVHAPLDQGGPERFHAHVIEEAARCAVLVILEDDHRSLRQSDHGSRKEAVREVVGR